MRPAAGCREIQSKLAGLRHSQAPRQGRATPLEGARSVREADVLMSNIATVYQTVRGPRQAWLHRVSPQAKKCRLRDTSVINRTIVLLSRRCLCNASFFLV